MKLRQIGLPKRSHEGTRARPTANEVRLTEGDSSIRKVLHHPAAHLQRAAASFTLQIQFIRPVIPGNTNFS
jgi:hypothetical protein